MSTREHNEKKFGHWEEKAEGGRIYRLEIEGKHGWQARYFKEVAEDETTLRFWQEILDEGGNLMEIHVKFPVDEGHRKV